MSAKDGQARFKPRDFVSVPRFLLGVCFLFAAAAFAQRPANTFATFDVTGAGRAINRGRWRAASILPGDCGYYYDALDVAHGFVRTAAGRSRRLTRWAPARARTRGRLPSASTRAEKSRLLR